MILHIHLRKSPLISKKKKKKKLIRLHLSIFVYTRQHSSRLIYWHFYTRLHSSTLFYTRLDSSSDSSVFLEQILFHIFTQSIKFCTFYYYVLRVQMFEKCDSSNSKNEWLLLSASFTAKFGLVFVVALESAFS